MSGTLGIKPLIENILGEGHYNEVLLQGICPLSESFLNQEVMRLIYLLGPNLF
jgi:hypothetical protein